MNSLAEDTKFGRRRSDRAITALRAAARALAETLAQRIQTYRDERELRRTILGPDRLDDRLLRDVGLRRDNLPNGRTRLGRR